MTPLGLFEALPSGHVTQETPKEAYFPGAHTVQAEEPRAGEIEPAGQAEQVVEPLGEKRPAGHTPQ